MSSYRVGIVGALKLPGTRWLMHRSIAAPRRCVRGAWTVDQAGQA